MPGVRRIPARQPFKVTGCSGSGRDSRSRLAALPRRCELEVSVRPSAAPRSFYNAAIQMTSELRNLSLSAFNPLGQHCSWSRDALGQGVVWVTPG